MEITNIIKKPLFTEKTYRDLDRDYYTFLVDHRAKKNEIKNAFEIIFEVKVAKVNTMNYSGYYKKVGQYEGATSKFKKAIIQLKPGYKLNLFENEDNASKKGTTK